MAFFCSYYHIIQFPNDAKLVYNEFLYVIFVEGVFDVCKAFFLVSGFLQAFSFLTKYGEKPTIQDVMKFILYRLLKVVPSYWFCLVYIIFVQKHIGSGPTWHLMDHLTEKCTKNNSWLANLFFVNNWMYDSGFD